MMVTAKLLKSTHGKFPDGNQPERIASTAISILNPKFLFIWNKSEAHQKPLFLNRSVTNDKIDIITDMKRILFNFCLFLALSGNTFAQDQITQEEFENFCDSIGLIFEMPEGYMVIDVKENRDLWYKFAVINEDSTMEIRYTVWSLAEDIKRYEESLNDSNITMISPNVIYRGRAQANVLNMTGGQMYDIGAFPPQAVNAEFNADAGGSCFFEFNSEFGQGYKYGQFVYLHKDNVADVIITYMSNSKETHSDLMMQGFYSLKFK